MPHRPPHPEGPLCRVLCPEHFVLDQTLEETFTRTQLSLMVACFSALEPALIVGYLAGFFNPWDFTCICDTRRTKHMKDTTGLWDETQEVGE